MITKTPKILFKYKSISDEKSLERTLDILQNKRLYLSNRSQLNDPFEGVFTPIEIPAAGNSLFVNNDMEYFHFTEICDHFKILSLSETVFSPQMWAYYSDSYKGICIGFYNGERFKNLKRVKYALPSDSWKCLDDHKAI